MWNNIWKLLQTHWKYATASENVLLVKREDIQSTEWFVHYNKWFKTELVLLLFYSYNN